MCGIIGVASDKVVETDWIYKGLDALYNRGPDDIGVYNNEIKNVCFGHRRLSIIDLSNNASQPMIDRQNKNVITFNGEIYNYLELKKELRSKGHIFFSNSDTEVILKAFSEWGTNCFKFLNGMFSVAIFNNRENQVILARDRAGEKPLYYSINNKILRFSSELKGLFEDKKVKRNIDKESFDKYLAWGYVPAKDSLIKDINKLSSGHFLKFDLTSGSSEISKYWSLPEFDFKSVFSFNEILDNCENLLEDSVSRQLISSDVPVGLLLSGGVDSSLITAFASRKQKKVNTFTITFPGYKKYDESSHSRLISNYFDTNHHEIEASKVDVDILNKLSHQFDEPIIDSSMIPTYMVSNEIKKYCKVAIGGDGADELFGGYSTYSRFLQLEKLQFLPYWSRTLLSKASNIILPNGFKGRNWLTNINCNIENFIPVPNSPFNIAERKKLHNNFFKTIIHKEQRKINFDSRYDIIQKATRLDFYNYLQEDILVKVDRASMLCSLEMRSPFLDYRLIEFAFKSIPSKFKVDHRGKKIILKALCRKILPKDFDFKRKQGFSIPLSSWFKEDPDWRSFYFDTMYSKDSIFDIQFVNNLYNGQFKGRINSEKIFGLLMFELWRKKYSINI